MRAASWARSRRRTLPWICSSCSRRAGLRRTRRTYATTSVQEPPDVYDVVCVGGGPAGLSLLTALRGSPTTSRLKIALVESQDLGRTRQWTLPGDQYSNRVSSLTPSSVGFLKSAYRAQKVPYTADHGSLDIGVWPHIQRDRVQAYTEMQVWDGMTDARVSFDWPSETPSQRARAPSQTIAYMTENLNLTSALLRRVDEMGGLQIFDNTRVEKIGLGPETDRVDLSSWPVVELSGGQRLAARLLVGADGANSPVRTFADIPSRGWDYDRHGVVATVRLQEGVRGPKTAYQRFLPTGPVALLPLPGNLATLVWTTLPSHASQLKSLSPANFTAMVNAAFRLSPVDLAYMHTQADGQDEELAWRLPHTPVAESLIPATATSVQHGSIASFPLRQGLNLGQGDVSSLHYTISASVAHGGDIGASIALEPYNAARYAPNNAMLGVVDKLHKLYSVSSGPLVPLRSWGLSAVQNMTGLKGILMRVAAGEMGG
ncbi:MAG: putative ubiquinone biosynthesis monooxygenase [Thelocarpon superellum]|nr:MAG: putative ubiquinone biosynthesis monooxygenase [Thelocarpon superellum]